MSEPLHRITYDATIDDAVDVSFRLANRTQAFRKQIRQNIIIAGTAAGLAFIAVWMIIGGGRTPFELVLAVAGGSVFGIMFAVIFRRFFEKEIRAWHLRRAQPPLLLARRTPELPRNHPEAGKT